MKSYQENFDQALFPGSSGESNSSANPNTDEEKPTKRKKQPAEPLKPVVDPEPYCAQCERGDWCSKHSAGRR